MNIETCYRLLLEQTHRSSQTDVDMALVAVINAMEYYKSFPYDFNNGWEQVFFPAGVERLTAPFAPAGFPAMRAGLPSGIRRPISIVVVGLVTSGNVSTGLGSFAYSALPQTPLRQVSVDQMWSMTGGVGSLTVTSPGYPQFWCWLGDGSIRIHPVPFKDMVVDVFYIKDAHRPRYLWASGAWSFEQLTVNNDTDIQYWEWTTLLPGFTNVWLEHAEPMIRARARFDLQRNFYSDKGAAEIAASTLREEEARHHYEMVSAMAGDISRTPSHL